ncbi:unnamed protein product [Urochloa humidicola]
MDGLCYLSEGVLRDDDFWDSWRGSAVQNEKKRNSYMSRSGAAFDQMKITNMARMAIWERSGIMLYSTTSNRYQINVAPTRTPADKFLSFHSRMSATARENNAIHEQTTQKNFGDSSDAS